MRQTIFLTLRRFGLALLALFFSVSCSSPEVKGFSWTGPAGEAVHFGQSASFPEGAEGHFDGAHLSNRYSPGQPFSLEKGALPAGASALEFAFRLPDGCTRADLALSLSARGDGRDPFFDARLGLSSPYTRFVIPLPVGEEGGPRALGSISISLIQDGGEKSAAELSALRFVPVFRGISQDREGPRISSGFSSSAAKTDGRAGMRLSIKTPFGGLAASPAGTAAGMAEGVPAIIIRYGAGSGGFELQSNGKKLHSLRARPEGASVVLPACLFPAGIDELSLIYAASEPLPDFSAQCISAEEAELADLGRIIRSPSSGADYELYRWDIIPSVLIFDFKNYDRQDAYLKRLAFFVEKAGYKGRLAPDSQIQSLHGWNAHDYRAEDLARFFEKARASSFRLDPEEEELRSILLSRGIIAEQNGAYAAGSGAIVSITHESEGYLRTLFLNHETSHAIFFTDPEYRTFVQKLWASMSQDEKWFWYAYFRWMVYDTSDAYLMANEFQAYLVQQTVGGANQYFTQNLAKRLADKHPELKDKIDTYMKTYGPQFTVRARAIDSFLYSKYGIGDGRCYFFW